MRGATGRVALGVTLVLLGLALPIYVVAPGYERRADAKAPARTACRGLLRLLANGRDVGDD